MKVTEMGEGEMDDGIQEVNQVLTGVVQVLYSMHPAL